MGWGKIVMSPVTLYGDGCGMISECLTEKFRLIPACRPGDFKWVKKEPQDKSGEIIIGLVGRLTPLRATPCS